MRKTGKHFFARGLTNYDSKDIEKVEGRRAQEMKMVIDIVEEVIHRNNLLVINS
jgi:glutamate 5-kinase